jgi:Lipocalin-like domain
MMSVVGADRRQLANGGRPAGLQQSAADRLVGHWSLVSCEAVVDGRTEYPYGHDPVGQLVYHPAGHMAAQIMRPGREPFASGDPGTATPDELSAALLGYAAYFGTYSVNESTSMVTHHIAASLFPNWVGGEQRRHYSFEGDRLTLSTPPILVEGRQRVYRLVWKRQE